MFRGNFIITRFVTRIRARFFGPLTRRIFEWGYLGTTIILSKPQLLFWIYQKRSPVNSQLSAAEVTANLRALAELIGGNSSRDILGKTIYNNHFFRNPLFCFKKCQYTNKKFINPSTFRQ